jgi:hypothetical protein
LAARAAKKTVFRNNRVAFGGLSRHFSGGAGKATARRKTRPPEGPKPGLADFAGGALSG